MAERLDPEDWRELLNEAFDRLAATVFRYEGTIAQFLGDGFLAFFGAPVAHEDDPLRGVLCGLDLLEEADGLANRMRKDGDLDFQIRVGINTGQVVVGEVGVDLRYEYVAVGDAVNLAARVQAAARPGTVLISENTHRLVAQQVEARAVGPVQLKGKSKPVAVFEIQAIKSQAASTRGPPGLTEVIVGREAEIAELTRLTRELQRGRGGVIRIVGEPGIGKSRLISEWRQRAGVNGTVRWAEGHCLSYGHSMPYHAAVDLVWEILGVSSTAGPDAAKGALDTVLDEIRPPERAEIRPYVMHLLSLPLEPEDEAAIRVLDGQALRHLYVQSTGSLLHAIALRTPLALVVEDVHWSDPSSADLLAQLVALEEQAPILFCFTSRPDKDMPGWRLLIEGSELASAKRYVRIEALSDEDAQHMIDAILGLDSLPSGLRSALLSRAEGNPLFLGEVIRMLMDRGMIVPQNGGWVAAPGRIPGEIPDSIGGLLLARIDRLPEGCRGTLRVASAIGRRFPADLLELVDEEPSHLPIRLDILEASGLITREPKSDTRYSFSHALVQEAAYGTLLKEDRRTLHGRLGEALELMHPDRLDEMAPSLGHHFRLAGDAPRALRYLSLAGEQAAARFANEEAADFYMSAIDMLHPLLGDNPDAWRAAASETHERLGDALEIVGRHAEAEAEYASALETFGSQDRRSSSRLLRKAALPLRMLHRWEDGLDALEKADLALGEPADEPWWWTEWIDIRRERSWLCFFASQSDRLAVVLEELHSAIEEHGSSAQQAEIERVSIMLAWRRDRYVVGDETMRLAESMLRRARDVGTLPELALARFTLGFCHLHRRELQEAQDHLERSSAIAERIGNVEIQARCLAYLVVVRRSLGDLPGTLRTLEHASATARRGGMSEYIAATSANRAWVAWRRGEAVGARTLAEEAVKGWDESRTEYPFKWLALFVLLALDVACEDLEAGLDRTRSILDTSQQRMPQALVENLEEAVESWDAGNKDKAMPVLHRAVAQAGSLGFL